jgi:hypothetical protein
MTEVEASKSVIISILSKSDLFVYLHIAQIYSINIYFYTHFPLEGKEALKLNSSSNRFFFFPTIYEFVKNCTNRAPCIVNRLFPYEW